MSVDKVNTCVCTMLTGSVFGIQFPCNGSQLCDKFGSFPKHNWRHPVAKKKASKVTDTKEPPALKPVRLDLPPSEHERLDAVGKRRGLSKAAVARMILMKGIIALEREDAAQKDF